ncbi:hypothetical protein WMY93_028371 [Mugilogobius chulae]|uniref:DDE Tnp4 domain-containing protein n=1 Tax=Mugilogobius chulae TaxID=88201 RepID=A0AAW0MYH7_9GOBI
MLRVSPFYNTWMQKMGDYKLLGDSAYISNNFPFVVTPKHDNGALSEDDLRRNAISRGRVVVEQVFGRLKCKWCRLRELQNSRVDVVVKIIVAACVLHNMCIVVVCTDAADPKLSESEDSPASKLEDGDKTPSVDGVCVWMTSGRLTITPFAVPTTGKSMS